MALFDAYDPGFIADPYPTYAALREHGPFFDEDWGLTFFSRHRDVVGILRDRRFGRDIRHVIPVAQVDPRTYPQHLPNWYRLIRGSFIDLEPPDHTRLRSAVNRSFTKTRAEQRRQSIRSIAEGLVAGVSGSPTNAVESIATPLPIAVIAELMDIPQADRQQLLTWSHAIVRVFDLNVTKDEQQIAETACIEFRDYLRSLIAFRLLQPGPDLISELANAEGGLEGDDLVATCILILNAGHEATVHAIGNGLLALARHPEVLAQITADPTLLPLAVDELLRFDSPLQMFERWVLEDTEWEGVALERGTKVGLMFGAANRDPEAFVDPNTLIPDRADNPHVAFGLGTHFCLGAPLARVELEEAFRAVITGGTEITLLDASIERTPSLIFRGPRALSISLT